jgi:hypothetical protein
MMIVVRPRAALERVLDEALALGVERARRLVEDHDDAGSLRNSRAMAMRWRWPPESFYFATSDAGGAFALDAVPPGRYTLVAWHERLGRVERTVEVGAGAEAVVAIEMGGRP